MYTDIDMTDFQPWYKQAWPWFLIALPASAVIGGIVTIYLALQSPNALVVDDYYKAGLAINQEKQQQLYARERQIQGLLRSDGKTLQLELSGRLPASDTRLTLNMIHSTRADLDREVTLKLQSGNTFRAALPALVPGIWYLRLEPADKRWEIRDRLTINGAFQAHLKAED